MITTITLNPALDKLLSIDAIEVGETNRVICLLDSAAGKGIDVAKALRCMAEPVRATGFLGGEIAGIFHQCFDKYQIDDQFINVKETTRTNIQIFDAAGERTELLEKGPTISDDEKRQLFARVEELAKTSQIITLCGSAPQGVTVEDYVAMIQLCKKCGATVIVDASSSLLEAACLEGVCLIKPNRKEILGLMHAEDASEDDIIHYALQLSRKAVPYVVISLGGDGAMLVHNGRVWRGSVPQVEVISTVGCGDTMVASLCISLKANHTPQEMLLRALAMSCANAMTFETAAFERSTYEQLLAKCSVENIKV